ncbi:DNA alkylation repair protein [Bacteroidales bacterium OttesenSCG-928-B11]|nr:DNA alkylation repair protein [Bacteroidales bacterium OttesenSCG-928-C03]MDL2313149.1 DNA alkylation repair protein [Bacteroidales bacterium OttesenSCG-928-B11]MDL2325549.1 DNA alkylation repair protein [Bacteroidales bacterium OttesenSCG-928-A14]
MNAQITQTLRSFAEADYKAFNQKLIPTNYEILGIRMPVMKKLAKELAKSSDIEAYLQYAEYDTYEHILLYGLILGELKKLPLETIFTYLDPLILKFDNWAHVDTLVSAFKIFAKHPDEVFNHFLPLKTHEGEFTKRFFVILLLDYFMDEAHIDMTLQQMAEMEQGQYYVDMAIAWTISVGLIKHYDKTFPVLEQRIFSKFVHNKAIQKARESYRIAPEVKVLLQKMKI